MNSKHDEAKALYAEYLSKKTSAIDPTYAQKVVKATGGSGKTNVEPLATMGTGGGPIVCDVCMKPMILEGGGYQGVYADEAWRQNPQKGWASYISGGMTLLLESNGSLRVHHNYEGSGCGKLLADREKEAREQIKTRLASTDVTAMLAKIRAYLKEEMPDKNTSAVMSDIYKVLFTYDPGPGVNHP